MGERSVSRAAMKAIEFVASVYKVQTLADGGLRLTLDFSETSIVQAAALMECKRTGTTLKINAKPESIQTRREPQESIA